MTSACLEQLLPVYYTRMTDYESDIYWVNQIRISQSWMLASNLFMDFQDVIPYSRALEQHFTYLMKRFFYLRFCGTLILFNRFEV